MRVTHYGALPPVHGTLDCLPVDSFSKLSLARSLDTTPPYDLAFLSFFPSIYSWTLARLLFRPRRYAVAAYCAFYRPHPIVRHAERTFVVRPLLVFFRHVLLAVSTHPRTVIGTQHALNQVGD